ncbi:MAG: RecQ family ATP-dependent DNA helicase [Sphaerochaetaceae bacterium]
MQKSDTHSTDHLLFKTLQTHFHLSSLYPYQELVIRTILEQHGLYGKELIEPITRALIVILPTGSGKSLCFMLPSVLVKGVTLIIYPLLSLMNDQYRRIQEAGFPVEILRGGQTYQQRQHIFNKLKMHHSSFLLTNPETLAQSEIISELQTFHISQFVIDEVHTLTQWGESFRPAFLTLPSLIEQLNPTQVLAFTATASRFIIQRISSLLSPHTQPHIITGNPDRPNIHYFAYPSLSKIHDLEMLLRYTITLPALIFCTSRKRCEVLASSLVERNIECEIRYYHAGLDPEQRREIESWFFTSEKAILIATSAYGLGVDKKNIRSVIHYDLPNDVESFLQESGRGGRDQGPTQSIVMVTKDDPPSPLVDLFSQHKRCRRSELLRLLAYPYDQCSGCDVCEHSYLTSYDGEKEIKRLCLYYPLRFSIYEAAHTLVGSEHSSPHRYNLNFGVLHSWKIEDVVRAIRVLIRTKELGIIRKRIFVRKINRCGRFHSSESL